MIVPDLLDRAAAELDTKTAQRAQNSSISPTGIIDGHSDHELLGLDLGSRASWTTSSRNGPRPGDQRSVPAERRPRNRTRNARFSAFRYSIRAAVCRSSQAAMLPESRATKLPIASRIK